MRSKKLALLLGLLPVVACAYSGHLSPKVETTGVGEKYRGGTVSYRNDSKAERRKNDAQRKIEKYCGGPYTIINGDSAAKTSAEATLIQFRCNQPDTQM